MSILPVEKSVIETRLEKQIILIYGRAKIGKSTFASQFPEPIFLATEPGLNHLSVYKINVNSWEKFLEGCSEISKGSHKFKTIIIDTFDNLVLYCADYICRENGVNHPSEIAHGKGYHLVTSELSRALAKLSSLPYGLVLISHCELETIETKTAKYSRWSIAVGGKNKGVALNLPDLILFIDSEMDKDGEEKRIIRTKPSKFWEGGDRTKLGIPETIPLDYKIFSGYFK